MPQHLISKVFQKCQPTTADIPFKIKIFAERYPFFLLTSSHNEALGI